VRNATRRPAAPDPFDSPEVNRLSDDIKTAEQTVEALYERRVGKVVKMASLAAADMPTEEEGLTREERDLFDTLLNAIEENRDHVLDVLAGEASPGAVNTPPKRRRRAADRTSRLPLTPRATRRRTRRRTANRPASAPRTSWGALTATGPRTSRRTSHLKRPGTRVSVGDQAASPASTEGQSDEEGGSETDVDRRTVRITDDVGAIFGVDEREYDLSTDDVVTLPAANADPLVERDAAEPLE